jgi:uncharacterized protein (DUF488 family)
VTRRLWTVGHSTLTFDELTGLLDRHAIELVCDVRRSPASSRHPRFSADALARTLPEHGIAYRHLAGLGGWRRGHGASPNTAWHNASFRAYADYALTSDFADALGSLCELALQTRTAIMCAEALWWRCHRRLVADRLVAAGWEVSHISSRGPSSLHRLPDFAVVKPDGSVVYPDSSSSPAA